MNLELAKKPLHNKISGREPEDLTDNQVFIEMKQLCKTYKGPDSEVQVLKNLDLKVAKGQSVAIVGASGVGKSTLLHLAGALDRPSAGHVYVDGRDIFSLNESALADFRNKQVGFVFQFHHLLPEFTALENTMMPALISRMDKKNARQLARELLNQVGLSHRENHRSGEMSGGEQQRVAVARALVMRPSLLLADEPTGNLDENTEGKVHELFVRLNKEMNLTTLVATHNENLARLMDRRVRLARGQVTE
jgi:lipoprotein-releasing system ATP-binding protein